MMLSTEQHRKLIREYRQSSRLNYSLLKALDTPSWVRYKMLHPDEDDNEDKPHLRIGDVLDIILTQDEEFNERYIYFDEKRPSGMMLKFIDNLPITLTVHSDESLYTDAYQISGYKTALPKIIDNLWSIKTNKSYYEFKCKSVGKTIISKDEMDMVIHLKTSFISNPYLRKYFIPRSDWEIFYQVPIYFTDKGVECKVLLDQVIFDHKNKLILPNDIKTTARGSKIFPREIIKFGYFLQAGHYRRGLELLCQGDPTAYSPVLASIPQGYTIDNFRFLVASKTKTSPGCIWKVSDNDYLISRQGGFLGDRAVKGVEELLTDYKWHQDTGNWDYSREMYDKNGELVTNLFDH